MRIIDISLPLQPGTELRCEQPAELPLYLGHPCVEYRFHLPSHVGCYYETAAHVFRGSTNTSDVPVEQFFLPAVVVKLRAEAQGAIEPEEITRAMTTELRRGDALLINTAGVQMRYFSRACGAWMAASGVALLAATLPKYDTGFTNPTGVFLELFQANIPILAGIRLEQIRQEQVFLIVLPIALKQVCTVPCRAIVLEGEVTEMEQLTQWLRADLSQRNMK